MYEIVDIWEIGSNLIDVRIKVDNAMKFIILHESEFDKLDENGLDEYIMNVLGKSTKISRIDKISALKSSINKRYNCRND